MSFNQNQSKQIYYNRKIYLQEKSGPECILTVVFCFNYITYLDMIRVKGAREAGLNALTRPSRPGWTKMTRQSDKERKLVIHVVYFVWLCFEGIL